MRRGRRWNGATSLHFSCGMAFSVSFCRETFSHRRVFNSSSGGGQASVVVPRRRPHCEGAMRAIFQPLLVVIAVVIAGFGAAEACRLALASVSQLQPVVARCCGNCRTTQSVETDLPFWSCQKCRQYHWLNSGEIPGMDANRNHLVGSGVAGPTGIDLRKLSREPADLAATSGSARGGDRRGNRVWDASRRRSPRTRAG